MDKSNIKAFCWRANRAISQYPSTEALLLDFLDYLENIRIEPDLITKPKPDIPSSVEQCLKCKLYKEYFRGVCGLNSEMTGDIGYTPIEILEFMEKNKGKKIKIEDNTLSVEEEPADCNKCKFQYPCGEEKVKVGWFMCKEDERFPKLLNAHAIMTEHIEKYHDGGKYQLGAMCMRAIKNCRTIFRKHKQTV